LAGLMKNGPENRPAFIIDIGASRCAAAMG
jgi:hypothetical protein